MKEEQMLTNEQAMKYARQLIPGGVNSPLRNFNEAGGNPICVKEAKGAYVYDVEGKRYTDFLLGFGPNILGHTPECVIKQLGLQIGRGSVYAATNVLEIKLAEIVLDSTPCMDQVRFVCSGTEAVMSAVRLAKGYTQREMILKFDGSYHGHCDSVLGQPLHTIDSRNPLKGIDRHVHENTIMVQYNDLEETKKAFIEHGRQIACVLVEPYACNMGLVKPKDGFLRGLRELCDQHQSILIFDEVITGFRMTYGSVYRDFNVEPDLITFGKVIGGGTPIGAYAGKKDIMRLICDEEQGVYQSGTFAGNAFSMAAGIAVLTELKKGDTYAYLEELGQQLEKLITEQFSNNKIPFLFHRKGSVFSFLFSRDCSAVQNFIDVEAQDTQFFTEVYQIMLERGFLLPPSADEVLHLCSEHTHADIEEFAFTLVETIKLIEKERSTVKKAI